MENTETEVQKEVPAAGSWYDMDRKESAVNAYVSDMLYGIDKFMKRDEPQIAKLYVRGIITFLRKHERELTALIELKNTTGVATGIVFESTSNAVGIEALKQESEL